jgi:hypothetical protein
MTAPQPKLFKWVELNLGLPLSTLNRSRSAYRFLVISSYSCWMSLAPNLSIRNRVLEGSGAEQGLSDELKDLV